LMGRARRDTRRARWLRWHAHLRDDAMERQCQVQAPRPGRDWVDVRRAGWSTPPPLPATKPKWTAPDGASDGRHGDQARTTWDSPAISLESNDVSGGLLLLDVSEVRGDSSGVAGCAAAVVGEGARIEAKVSEA
jgi:hypothetical protein